MDLSSITGGNASNQGQQPAIVYTAQASSPIVNGEAKLTIGEKALSVATLFASVDVAFAEMNELRLADYVVTVKADSGSFAFSRMGDWSQPFYDALCGAYNKAVLRSLFIGGAPIVTARGYYRFDETPGMAAQPTAPLQSMPIYVYENSVVTLPADLTARRVPLCFVSGMDKSSFELTLKLDTGESYTYAKLGYETAVFSQAVENQIRKMREKTLTALRGVDPALTSAQASRLAGLMPQGVAAPIGQLAAIAPSFVAALEGKISATRAAESYGAFKELCGAAHIWLGFRENDDARLRTENDENGNMGGLTDSISPVFDSELSPESGGNDGDRYMIWLVAPSPNGMFAAVEFAAADSATFVYRTGGNFTAFARKLNRALEAISFRREVIRLTDTELLKPENADYYMAAKRTAALQFIRLNFTGRAIHSGIDAWKRKLTQLWNG